MIGLVRIMQGGYFFSDAVGAFVVVRLTNAALYTLARRCGWIVETPV